MPGCRVCVMRHVGPVELAPFALVGLRAMEAIEGKCADHCGICRLGKFRQAESFNSGETDDWKVRQAARN